MTIKEIADVMDLYRKFTMKVQNPDGTVKEAEDAISVAEHGLLERLIMSMRYINKVLTPAFIRDWCLKCCRHLKSTAEILKAYRQAKNTSMQLFASNSSKASLIGSKVNARHVLENTHIDEREFLCLMCNAFDRQQIIREIHDPDFS